MPIIETRKWFPLQHAPPRFPNNPHLGTVFRWATKGVKVGPAGERVKLVTRKIGGRRFTCQEWIDEFIDRLNEVPARQEALSRQRAVALAEDAEELDAEGIN